MLVTNLGKKGIIEKGPGFASGLRDLRSHLNISTISAGVIATIFGCTGPALIIINSAQAGNWTTAQTISWLFSIYFLGGVISLILALYYKQPINGAWSIPGAVLLATTLPLFSINEAAGGFVMAGLLVFILGITGIMGKVMNWIPLPIVMAMIAGAMIRFGTGVVESVQKDLLIAGSALLAFLVAQRVGRNFPGTLVALIVGILVGFNQINLNAMDISYAGPSFFIPEFNLSTFLSISFPLALLVIGAENAQAFGVLRAEGYRPPINAMTVISGIGGIVAGFFGGHNANIAGPMTAICSSSEAGPNKEGRYAASVVNGVLFGSFGILAGFAVPFVEILPGSLINTVAGLAMIGVLVSAFEHGFSSHRFQIGAFAALVIAMSGLTLFSISAPFWSLVGGVIVSLFAEPNDFRFKEQIQSGSGLDPEPEKLAG